MHIIIMLLLISVLVLIHELGHFGVAKLVGVKPERFGFGLPFGPTLYETTWGDTKICIHALLLGGYVAFADDDPNSNIPENDPSRLANRKIWERFAIISAGVVANAILAYLIVLFVAGVSKNLPSGQYDIFINQIESGKSVHAQQTGIKAGDRIVSANGIEMDSPFKFIELAQRSKANDNYVSYSRVNEQKLKIKNLNPTLKLDDNTVIIAKTRIKLPVFSSEGALSFSNKDLTGMTESKPIGTKLNASQQELRDNITNKKYYIADGKTTINDLAYATGDTNHPIYIIVNRNNQNIQLKPAFPNKNGVIGLKLKSSEKNVKITGPLSAIHASNEYISKNVVFMIAGLWQIVTGQIPLSNLHGIVAVTKVGSDIIAQKGMWDGLLLTALISIDLAIVNLLPIPALDGGHLLFLLIEKLRGKPVNEKMQEAFAKYGFLFLIGLMILIIFNDVWALITDKL